MLNPIPFGDDLITSSNENIVGLESFSQNNVEVNVKRNPPQYKPVNIVIENGIYYVTIYVCETVISPSLNESVMIWLDSLKPNDYVKLSVSSLLTGLLIHTHISLLAAIVRCKATIEIQLDTIVCDNLAYFYMAADKVNRQSGGALFIPSYIDSDVDKKSDTWVIIHEFVKELIDRSEGKGFLTPDEALSLHSGKPVVVSLANFV